MIQKRTVKVAGVQKTRFPAFNICTENEEVYTAETPATKTDTTTPPDIYIAIRS